jgi:pantoate--beta-alanine ligase
MLIIHTVSELRAALSNQTSIGFVPTMGNLHAGHIHLVSLAKQHTSCVVASIFVNPLQFGANEDFGSYPRTLEADCEKLKAAGANIVFAPTIVEMYSDFDGKNLNQSMTITPPAIADTLCGASRPGHFAGVATVVMKLFNIVNPNVAVFGKKDFQQLFIIKEMIKQFNLAIGIVEGETMREASGLAMSSRNGYLSDAQRTQAAQLNVSLQNIANQLKSGEKNFNALQDEASQALLLAGWEVDYVSICSAHTLKPAQPQDQHLVVLGAAKIANNQAGKTRLIDNVEVHLSKA